MKSKNDILAFAVATGQSVRAAAELAGVSERTATRRVADPDFRIRVGEIRAELLGRATGILSDTALHAAEALRELLGEKSPGIRLKAARSVLELGLRCRELAELEQRVAELERRLAIAARTKLFSGDGDGNPQEKGHGR